MEKKISVPKSLDAVTLKQWREISRTNNEGRVISILTGLTLSEVGRMTKGSKDRILKTIEGLFDIDREFPLQTFWTHKGVKYGLHPDLWKLTLDEWADLETYIQELDENLEIVMSILYRPVTEQRGKFYKIKEYKGGKAGLFEDFPVSYAFAAVRFFLTIAEQSRRIILKSSQVERVT